MKKHLIYMLISVLTIPAISQSRQATHISVSAICNGQLSFWDHETAILKYSQSTHIMTMTTDLFEITDDYTRYEHEDDRDVNGIPLSLTTNLAIDGLDFKSAKNNGETFTFPAQITCNGITKTINVTYTLIYAPRVAGSDLNDAPLCSFRLDATINLRANDFKLDMSRGCDDLVIRVQDGLLNRQD